MNRRTVADRVSETAHAGSTEGADAVVEAIVDGRSVRIGLWADAAGRARRARFRSTTCAALIAYADLACELIESGEAPDRIDAGMLREALPGVHPAHHDRADLVARALALAPRWRGTPGGETA
jgi:hypothetical protein